MPDKRYHATRLVEIVLDGESLEIEADIEFTIEPYSPGWFDPRYGGEPPSGGGCNDVWCKGVKFGSVDADAPKPDCPEWLSDWIASTVDGDGLYQEAMEQIAYERDEAADFKRREMRDEPQLYTFED